MTMREMIILNDTSAHYYFTKADAENAGYQMFGKTGRFSIQYHSDLKAYELRKLITWCKSESIPRK